MKTALILFGAKKWQEPVFLGENNKKYQYGYEELYSLFENNGIKMYRASHTWFDLEKNIFRHAWSYNSQKKKWVRENGIKPDIILDKTNEEASLTEEVQHILHMFPSINNPLLTILLRNKIFFPALFPKWCPKTLLFEKQMAGKIDLFFPKNENIVLKPNNLSGGSGVYIDIRDSVIETIKKNPSQYHNWILQEWVDSSSGIPGLPESREHDLRIVIINSKISYTYYRTPAAGSLVANLAQGGTKHLLDLTTLPPSLYELLMEVINKLSSFPPSLYAVDVVFDPHKRPWIIEINSMPGMYFSKQDDKNMMVKVYTDILGLIQDKLLSC